MSDESTTNNSTSLTTTLAEDAALQLEQRAVDRILNMAISGLGSVAHSAQARLKSSYERYLEKAFKRYNQVCTLVNRDTPRPIVGNDNIYISLPVWDDENKKKISTITVQNLLQVSNNLLICGSGGAGKSMMMRYLFLNTCKNATHIPVLLELRKISTQNADSISIFDLVYKTMADFDVVLPKDAFEASLRQGKYLFLLDAYDEIANTHLAKAGEAIQAFVSKYPDNSYIMTSREGHFASFQTFTKLKTVPLSKQQAITLAKKFRKPNEKTIEFCRQLEQKLFDEYKSFAENPLLLSMMFLTFMENNDIPNHLVDFYEKTFHALYSGHDGWNKGDFVRQFRGGKLSERDFKLVFAQFCFQSYRKDIHEFTKEDILSRLLQSINKTKVTYSAENFLYDLQRNVCVIIQEGTTLRFAHRSFQDYFAACYTNFQNDDTQKRIYRSMSNDKKSNFRYFYLLCCQMNRKRYLKNALEDYLRKLARQMANNEPLVDIFGIKDRIALSCNDKAWSVNWLYIPETNLLDVCFDDGRMSYYIIEGDEAYRDMEVLLDAWTDEIKSFITKKYDQKEIVTILYSDLEKIMPSHVMHEIYQNAVILGGVTYIPHDVHQLLAELEEDSQIDDLDDL